MNHELSETPIENEKEEACAVTSTLMEKAPDCPSGPAARVPSGRVAKIRCLDQVKARGFTFARGRVVEGVPLAHAEYLAAGRKAEILEVI
ncbi:hypothetical protein OKA05_27250 [Luteolibacter arcticus]|uniref:Uncharacterized protein n=1 Tax=Luteolibacter arcticus TaxID=1581411 RepID=A0ABT3GRX5_9BACT|nr:hypothetical protein [Luteolibacter arcticus]MCW1926281.1 hypothetical protein [Luteolibacter arcticus]